MTFAEFEQLSTTLWEEIPADYKSGVEGLVVEERARRHPERRGVFTMGECLTEDYPSAFGGPDTTRSVVVLYYGSFRAIARREDTFDWRGEIWETLTHELQHHLESLASEDLLEGVDYAAEENFKRLDGEPFDPAFYRSGIVSGEGVYRVEDEVFVEVLWRGEPPRELRYESGREELFVEVPEDIGDLCFIDVSTAIDGDVVTFVLARQRSAFAAAAAWIRRAPFEIVQVELQGQLRPRGSTPS